MSKVISAMLGQPEHVVKRAITKLEAKNGYPSHDARTVAENIQKVRNKLNELKLDPDDTTAEELYHALLVKFQSDSLDFDSHFGADIDKFDQKAAKAGALVSKIELPEVWVLKSSPAKALLHAHRPKRTMKRLGYRSIDSMLKRENLAELYLAVSFVESEIWNKTHIKLLSALDTTSFELRSLKLRSLSANKWGEFGGQSPAVYTGDFGVLGLVPSVQLRRAPLLSLVVVMMDQLAAFKDINISSEAAKLSPAVAWWEDMDNLIAGLDSKHVSMNIKDVAVNQLNTQDFKARELDTSRRSFWNSLLARYNNQLQTEEDALLDLNAKLRRLKLPLNQPVFEYAEDI